MQSKILCAAVVVALASFAASAAPPANSPAATRAQSLLSANPAAASRNAGDAFAVRDVMLDANGTEHVRMERTYQGLPVFGGDVVVHSRGGSLKSVSKTLKTSTRPSLDARISADQAIEAAGVAFGSDIKAVPVTRKVVYAHNVQPTLAWEVRLLGRHDTGTPIDLTYFVNANTGQLLLGVSNVHHAKPTKSGGGKSGGSTTEPVSTTPGIASVGTGASLHNGSVVLHTTTGTSGYLLTDSIRGASVTMDGNNHDLSVVAANATVFEDGDNAWGDGNKRTRATVAVDAHYGAANAWDYFAQNFGRLGIWGDGKGSTSYVHVGSSMSNAYWYRGAMYFGDGNNFRLPYVSLDIVAHEMSHGVTQATAGLIYSGESGGLNEATSDIFGTMAEHFANNPHDVPDYTIGEKLMKSGAIRYMYKPSLNGSAPDCYSAEVATMGPHAASGIGNHFFYLLAEGAVAPAGTSVSPSDLVCNGNTGLQGVGRDAAQRIWYQALTRYMTSGTSYAGARQATLQAAADLFGAGSIQQHTVAAAWSAVAVN